MVFNSAIGGSVFEDPMIIEKMFPLLIVCFLSVNNKPALSSHIVGMANHDYISHHRVLWKLGKELQSRGHKYTQILPSCAKETYDDIDIKIFNTSVTNKDIEDVLHNLTKLGDIEDITGVFRLQRFLGEIQEFLMERFCQDLFQNTELIAELKKSVDLVLCDASNVCCFILVEMLDSYRVDVWPVGFSGAFGSVFLRSPQAAVYLTQETSANPTHPDTFSFTNRLLSYITSRGMWYALGSFVPVRLWEKYAKANSKHADAFDALRAQGIVLIPHDFALEYPRPLQPNVKVIGPVLPEPPQELPRDLNKFMMENDQVVVMAFGATLSKHSERLIQVISDGLSQLSVAVLWKYSGKMPKNIGKNVKIVSWIPQNDILGHPSTKVFVTHCGLNSMLESVYHSVPMVALPLVGDGHRHANVVKMKKLGVILDKKEMKPEDLAKAVMEVLVNTIYRENTERISAIIKDRKRSPAEEGADWIEYALRHNGATHLISEALELPEYKMYMFDVFLFLLLVVIFFHFMFVCLCCCLCYCLCKGKIGTKAKVKQS